MTPAEAQALINESAAKLAEHFDSVQIVASRVEESGGTRSWHGGLGDWYARRGLCEEFIERDQSRTLAQEIHNATPPTEGEEWKKT
jgi:hypothetical protein